MRTAIEAPSLVATAASVRRGLRSPTELVEEALSRLDVVEPYIAAFTLVAADRAQDEGRQLTEAAASGRWRGPLHGVPVAVKDLYDVAGEVTGAGSRLPPTWHSAASDAAAVASLRAAGAIVIGRTRTHEYAWGLTTQHEALGGSRNPYDSSRVPGGSSGGSAAAVAAGVVSLALGTDTAGSIRLPAAWCGLVGHKPSFGRVSLAGAVPLAPSFDHAGALVRTVADARLALSVLAGSGVRRGAYSQHLNGLRVGLPTDASRPTCDDAISVSVQRAVDRAREAGAVAMNVDVPSWASLQDIFFVLQASEALRYHRSLGHWPEHADLYGEDVRSRLALAVAFSGDDVARGARALRGLRAQARRMFDVVDVLLQPVAGSGPSLVRDPDRVWANGRLVGLREQVLPHTLLASLCGLPACSVPAGLDPDGLPVGVQVIGGPGRDELVLDVAGVLGLESKAVGLPE